MNARFVLLVQILKTHIQCKKLGLEQLEQGTDIFFLLGLLVGDFNILFRVLHHFGDRVCSVA